jgi:hypothetical protein
MNPPKAMDLFIIMTRLEFALKANGFFYKGRSNEVIIDWDRFANERLGKDFFDYIHANNIAKNLCNNPPRIQTVDDNGRLEWQVVAKPDNVQNLLGCIRRVRNNLFHGSKYDSVDYERDNQLIENALNVIKCVIDADASLNPLIRA